MADRISPERRSAVMARIRHKDTAPELIVRRLLHGRGYRYRLHSSRLTGKPDLVFSGRRKVIFIHGCFWHGHDCPRGARPPKANADYWRDKIHRNRTRDQANLMELAAEGWETLVVWECETRFREDLERVLVAFLGER